MEELIEEILKIREAHAADLPGILPLYGQLGMDEGNVLGLNEATRLFERIRSYPDYRLYIALAEGRIVGLFALLIMDNLGHCGAPSGIVEDVIVREGLRGRGIGKEMMRFAMARCRDKGCYKIVLSSNCHRADAHRFYRKLGFELQGYSFGVNGQ
jgi:GNAT superfamily N-acetyltransferase